MTRQGPHRRRRQQARRTDASRAGKRRREHTAQTNRAIFEFGILNVPIPANFGPPSVNSPRALARSSGTPGMEYRGLTADGFTGLGASRPRVTEWTSVTGIGIGGSVNYQLSYNFNKGRCRDSDAAGAGVRS